MDARLCSSHFFILRLKSDWGLGRIYYKNYKDCFCLYKISFTRQVIDTQLIDGPTTIEARQSVASLDAHLTFGTAPRSDLVLICMFEFGDSFDIVKDENSDRSVVLNYPIG